MTASQREREAAVSLDNALVTPPHYALTYRRRERTRD